MSSQFVTCRSAFCQVICARCTMRRMRAWTPLALVALALSAGCKRAPAPAVHSDGGAAATVVTQPNGPTLVRCPDSGCPDDEAGPARNGGDLALHVEAEPAV